MSESPLTSFWIKGPDRWGPLGYGVTAFTIEDAWEIIERAGYSLPEEKQNLKYRTVRSVDDLSDEYVRKKAGPMIFRGIWYPFTRIGVSPV